VRAVREELARRHVLVPFAEGTRRVRRDAYRLEPEVAGTLPPLGRDDDPAAADRILTQLRHAPLRPALTRLASSRSGRSASRRTSKDYSAGPSPEASTRQHHASNALRSGNDVDLAETRAVPPLHDLIATGEKRLAGQLLAQDAQGLTSVRCHAAASLHARGHSAPPAHAAHICASAHGCAGLGADDVRRFCVRGAFRMPQNPRPGLLRIARVPGLVRLKPDATASGPARAGRYGRPVRLRRQVRLKPDATGVRSGSSRTLRGHRCKRRVQDRERRVGLLARQHERRRQADRVGPGAEHQQPALKHSRTTGRARTSPAPSWRDRARARGRSSARAPARRR
jgi:hypothetical protein